MLKLSTILKPNVFHGNINNKFILSDKIHRCFVISVEIESHCNVIKVANVNF